jgi:hypothetical protein
MPISVKQSIDGSWSVVLDGKAVSSGLTNAQAWRQADRLAQEPRLPRHSVFHGKRSARPLTHADRTARLFQTKTGR